MITFIAYFLFLRELNMLKRGFTLIELLIYISIVSILIVSLSSIFIVINKGAATNGARSVVDSNLRFALNKIEHDIRSASDILVPSSAGDSSASLVLIIDGITTTYRSLGGKLQHQINTSTIDSITDDNVKVNTTDQPLTFTRLENVNPVFPSSTYPSILVRMNLRYDSTNPDWQYNETKKIAVTSRQPFAIQTWPNYLGCFVDDATRALPSELYSANATVESCTAAAQAAGFTYAGVQFGGECWAGNTLGFAQVSESECATPCTADPTEICGDDWRNSIYQIQPIPLPPPPESTYLGCFVDDATRALPNALAAGGSTIESCTAAAYAAGFTYAGLQWGGECWAGDTLGFAHVSDGECTMVCTANPSQICGDNWRNSIYQIN